MYTGLFAAKTCFRPQMLLSCLLAGCRAPALSRNERELKGGPRSVLRLGPEKGIFLPSKELVKRGKPGVNRLYPPHQV